VGRSSNFEQATSGGAGEPVVAPRSIGNRVEAAGFAAPRRTPSLGRVLFGKPELGQRAQCGAGLRESEPRFHRDPGLGFVAMSERDQASRLRLGEDKISSLGHAAAPPGDSSGHSMRH
jgi:hypothetical protein